LGDQYGNARFVCDVWRVGVEVEVAIQVERGKIRAAIEKLMGNNEGKDVRERMKNLKELAAKGIKVSGPSHTAFLNLVDLILSFEIKHLFETCNSCWYESVDMYFVVSSFHIIEEREVILAPLIMDEL